MKPAINKADGIRMALIDGLFMNRVMSLDSYIHPTMPFHILPDQSLSEDRFVSIKSALGAFFDVILVK